MINCPECGADNMIGAIFCRGCGKKLNLDELTPDAFDDPPEPMAKKVARVVQKIVTLIVFVGVVALLGGLFWPAGDIVKGDLDEQAMKQAEARFKLVQQPNPKYPKIIFSSEQATAALNQALGLPGSATGNKQAQHLSVEFLAGGNLRVVLKASLFGQIPMYTKIVCKPELTAPGQVQFTVLSVHAGKISLPANLRKNAIKQFSSLFQNATEVNQAKANVKKFTIGADNLTVLVNVPSRRR
jgi:uncharacterized protein YpmS